MPNVKYLIQQLTCGVLKVRVVFSLYSHKQVPPPVKCLHIVIYADAFISISHQHQQQQVVDVMWQHQEGQHLVGEEALHSDAEPGSSA